MSSLDAIERRVQHELEQLPRDYSAGLCLEDARTRINVAIERIGEVLNALIDIRSDAEE